jgi:hypothetical protein
MFTLMPLTAHRLTLEQRSQGLVSEAGLERLAKKLELEFMWESSMGSSEKKTLIVAGSALELLVEFSNNVVQSVSLGFPDSAEIVNKHAETAGAILFKDLQLRENQSPLTKSLEKFAANFERLAVLDKLSITPGLNLYEAVAGIYESLTRLHLWELQKIRDDISLEGKSDEILENLALCTKSGKPTMNARGRVGMTLDYWKERRLQPLPGPDMADWAAEHEQIWSILVGCAQQREIGVSPVRISDKWIGATIEKAPLPDELHTGDPIIDWLEPESTFVPMSDQAKADPMQAEGPLLGPRLPEVVFHATFDPPVHIPLSLWHQIQELGCVLEETELRLFDNLVIPLPPGTESDPAEMRTVTCTKKTIFIAPPGDSKLSLKTHANTLYVYRPVVSRTLTQMTFSHPQQLVSILPYLRQYTFLAVLLKNSFKSTAPPSSPAGNGKQPASSSSSSSSTKAVTTDQAAFEAFMAEVASEQDEEDPSSSSASQEPLNIDITLTLLPVPRLRVLFPFRDRTASVTLEIRENGQVHVEAQNVLDEGNMVAANGRQRSPEDVGKLLETVEDVGKWVEFMRTRWA